VERTAPNGTVSWLRTLRRPDGSIVWVPSDAEAEHLIAGGVPQTKMTGDAYDKFVATLSGLLAKK
jgi:hypothetical protein